MRYFSSPGSLHYPMYSDNDDSKEPGFPIRKSADQSLFATPHGFSQRTTSFIASRCQGIHQTPLRRLINPASNGQRPHDVAIIRPLAPEPGLRQHCITQSAQPDGPHARPTANPLSGTHNGPGLARSYALHHVQQPMRPSSYPTTATQPRPTAIRRYSRVEFCFSSIEPAPRLPCGTLRHPWYGSGGPGKT